MSEPIVEQIAANVASTVAAVTVANGYHQDLTASRPTSSEWRDGRPQANGTVIIVQDDADENEEHSTAGNPGLKAWSQGFALVAYVIASEASTAAMDTAVNRVRADLEKALTIDRTRGNLAIDTIIRAAQHFAAGPGATGTAVIVDVLYRTREDDPYTAG